MATVTHSRRTSVQIKVPTESLEDVSIGNSRNLSPLHCKLKTQKMWKNTWVSTRVRCHSQKTVCFSEAGSLVAHTKLD